MVWATVHWHHALLELQEKKSPPIHATIRHKSSQEIQSQITKETTSAISKYPNHLWRK